MLIDSWESILCLVRENLCGANYSERATFEYHRIFPWSDDLKHVDVFTKVKST